MDVALIKNIEFKLKTLKYSDAEISRIADLVNKEEKTTFDKSRLKFQRESIYAPYGMVLTRFSKDVI